MQTEQLIQHLLNPTIYQHPVSLITTIETHISIVFLTGDYAYKLKKPVNFGFLDFSTLEARQQFCSLELTLNRRTAPDLYLDVCPLYASENWDQLSFTPLGPKDEPIEYLVKMRQFDPNLVLGKHLQAATLNPSQVSFLAKTIAHFHLNAESVEPACDFGHPDNLIQPMLDNFPSLLSTFEHPEQQYRLRQLAEWTHFTQKTLWDSLWARKQNGFVKACHGDMHLDNIALINDQPILFDGIEFNEQFRWIDTLNDLAFLLIDLDYRQQFGLKRQILNDYINETGDFAGLTHLRFYQVYRAMVRSKITALRYHQFPVNSLQRTEYWQRALDYLKQAEDYAYQIPNPQLILMQGISGSGKSYYAQQILKQQDFLTISSDRERKRLFGISALTRVTEEQRSQLYSAQMNQATYERLQELTTQLLTEGFSVIVDATFLKAQHRQPYFDIARQTQANLMIFSIATNPDIAGQQILHRQTLNQDPSDADLSVMQHQLKINETPNADFYVWQQPAGVEFDPLSFSNWAQDTQEKWQEILNVNNGIA